MRALEILEGSAIRECICDGLCLLGLEIVSNSLGTLALLCKPEKARLQ